MGVLKILADGVTRKIGCGGTDGTPVLAGSYANANSANTITVGSVDQQVGDVLIASVATGGVNTYAAPAGWTTLQVSSLGFGGFLRTMYRVVTTASASATYLFTGANTTAAYCTLQVYRGVLIPTVSGKQEATSGSTLTAPSVTATGSGFLYVAFQWASSIGGGTATTTLPSGLTLLGGQHLSSRFVEMDVLDRSVTGAGATGAYTATAGGPAEGLIGHSVFLEHDPAAATTGRLKLYADGRIWQEACDSDTLIVANAYDTDNSGRGTNGDDNYAQAFTVTSTVTVRSLSWIVHKDGTHTRTDRVGIASALNSGSPSPTWLGKADVEFPDPPGFGVQPSRTSFALDAAVTLTPGTTYYLVKKLVSTSDVTKRTLVYSSATADSTLVNYSPGATYLGSGNTFTSSYSGFATDVGFVQGFPGRPVKLRDGTSIRTVCMTPA